MSLFNDVLGAIPAATKLVTEARGFIGDLRAMGQELMDLYRMRNFQGSQDYAEETKDTSALEDKFGGAGSVSPPPSPLNR